MDEINKSQSIVYTWATAECMLSIRAYSWRKDKILYSQVDAFAFAPSLTNPPSCPLLYRAAAGQFILTELTLPQNNILSYTEPKANIALGVDSI